jgi:stringent starvation protein B
MYVLWKYDWLIDWCLTPTLVVFQLYHGVLMEI